MQTPNSTTPKTPKPSTHKIDEIQEFLDLYYISWFRINQTYNLWAQCHGIQDSTMFLLDEIHRNPEYCTQSMLVSKVLLPKQTVSSALRWRRPGSSFGKTTQRISATNLYALLLKDRYMQTP